MQNIQPLVQDVLLEINLLAFNVKTTYFTENVRCTHVIGEVTEKQANAVLKKTNKMRAGYYILTSNTMFIVDGKASSPE